MNSHNHNLEARSNSTSNNTKNLPMSVVKALNEAVDILEDDRVEAQEEKAQPSGEQTPLQHVFANQEAVAMMEKPKRPLTSYNLFFQEERRQLYEKGQQGIGFANLAKTIASKWKATSKEDRKVFDELAVKDRARYDSEMKVWKKKQQQAKKRIQDTKQKQQKQQQTATPIASPRPAKSGTPSSTTTTSKLPPLPPVPTVLQGSRSSPKTHVLTPPRSDAAASTPACAPPSMVLPSPAALFMKEQYNNSSVSPLAPPPELPSSSWAKLAMPLEESALPQQQQQQQLLQGSPLLPKISQQQQQQQLPQDNLNVLNNSSSDMSNDAGASPLLSFSSEQLIAAGLANPPLGMVTPSPSSAALAAHDPQETNTTTNVPVYNPLDDAGLVAMCWGDEEEQQLQQLQQQQDIEVANMMMMEPLAFATAATATNNGGLHHQEPTYQPQTSLRSLADRFGQDCTDMFIHLFSSGGNQPNFHLPNNNC